MDRQRPLVELNGRSKLIDPVEQDAEEGRGPETRGHRDGERHLAGEPRMEREPRRPEPTPVAVPLRKPARGRAGAPRRRYARKRCGKRPSSAAAATTNSRAASA